MTSTLISPPPRRACEMHWARSLGHPCAGPGEYRQRELTDHGLVRRNLVDDRATNIDGVPGCEGTVLATSFWLADALHGIGRTDEAAELFERLLALRNDVGLLSEEYDPATGHHLGNTPQAFSHAALVTSALTLSVAPAVHRESSLVA